MIAFFLRTFQFLAFLIQHTPNFLSTSLAAFAQPLSDPTFSQHLNIRIPSVFVLVVLPVLSGSPEVISDIAILLCGIDKVQGTLS